MIVGNHGRGVSLLLSGRTEMVVYNKGKKKIMIVVNWEPDPKGGPAILNETISLLPGDYRGVVVKLSVCLEIKCLR